MRIDFVGPARRWQDEWHEVAERLSHSSDPAVALALRQGFVLTRAQARAVGCSDADVRRHVYRREWSVPRYGVLTVLPPGDGSAPDGTCLEVRAAAAVLVRPGTAISHASAAAAAGLPRLGRPARPELTSASIPRTADRGGARVYAAGLHSDDVVGWFGARITSPARTVCDLARHGRRTGLVVADAALHERLVSADQLARVLRRSSGWPGVRKARAIIELACELVESPLESLSRLLLHDHGVPLPAPQCWIPTARGPYRVDGLWPQRMVVLECDGMVKYRTDPDAREAEKKRHEALWRAGFRVVRVLWEDVVRYPDETVARVRRELSLGGPGLDPRALLLPPTKISAQLW